MMDRRMVALLETALHPATNEGERSNALSLFRGLTEKAGGLERLFSQSGAVVAAPPFVSYTEKRANDLAVAKAVADRDARIAILEADVERLVAEKAKLDARIVSLESSGSKAMRVADDGSMDYPTWARQAAGRLGSYHNWQQAFEDQTGLSKSRIQSYRARGRVDDQYVKALHQLTPIVPVTRYKERWTIKEVNRLRTLTLDGKTEADIAAMLTAEFARVVTTGMLKRVKLDSRERKGVFADPAYGAEIGRSRK